MPRSCHTATAPWLPLLLVACGGGDPSNPVGGANVPPELLACRARFDSPHSFAEIALRSARNLGLGRIGDRAGMERHARLHPDGNTVLFVRERDNNDPESRELFTSTIDGSRAEVRLSQNLQRDDEPCWSPDGSRMLFTSERAGPGCLWLADADGGNARVFLTPPAGATDGEADWCRSTDRIVFSRRDANGRHGLWLVQGDGTGLVLLTDGGLGTGDGAGDHAPAFAADGGRVACVRRLAAGLATLCIVDVAAGTVTTRLQPAGEVGMPRWSPAADRLFFGIAEPAAGRQTMRLASIPVAAGEPSLLWPDERWRLEGLDVFPGLGEAVATRTPQRLEVENAQIQIAAGLVQYAVRSQLAAADDDEFVVFTATSGDHEVAAINCRFDLPVLVPEDIVELRIRAVARTGRIGGDTALRMSIYNPIDERFDTAVELAPASTAAQTMAFTSSSLRHVTRERQLRITVVGEIAAGARSELRIDLVEVVLVARATPP